MARVAVYAGSFDPPTLGHEDIIKRASRMFDTLYVGIGVNSSKTPFIPIEDRLHLLKEQMTRVNGINNVVVTSYEGLLVDFCKLCAADFIVRGVRNIVDFDYESSLNAINLTQAPGLETVLLLAKRELSFVSSSAVKELIKHKGVVFSYVSPAVYQYLFSPRPAPR